VKDRANLSTSAAGDGAEGSSRKICRQGESFNVRSGAVNMQHHEPRSFNAPSSQRYCLAQNLTADQRMQCFGFRDVHAATREFFQFLSQIDHSQQGLGVPQQRRAAVVAAGLVGLHGGTDPAGRRRKLAKVLEVYGERLQWSIFECRLQPHQLRRLRQLLACIATADDSVRIWSVPQRAPAAEQLGRSVEHTPSQDNVI
jgi:CRISPR-associated protein Cas2